MDEISKLHNIHIKFNDNDPNTKSKQQLIIKTKHRRVREMLTFFPAKASGDHARSVLVWHSCSVECEVLLLSVSITLITQLHHYLLTCFYIFKSRRFETSLLATSALCTSLEMSNYQTVVCCFTRAERQ